MRIKPGSLAYKQAFEAWKHFADKNLNPSAGAVSMRAMHISGKRSHPFVQCDGCSYFAKDRDICTQGQAIRNGGHSCHRYNPKEFHDPELLKDVQGHIEKRFKS